MLRHRRPTRGYAPADAQDVMGYLAGELTEKAAGIRLSQTHLKPGHTFMDGHEPFDSPNFRMHNNMRPKNLDLVEILSATGEVTAIYEVKSTTTPGKVQFEVNGQCSVFMQRAADVGIPTYLVIVRMDRRIDEGVLRRNLETERIEVNVEAYDSEVEHILKRARMELYDSTGFKMENGMFVVFGEPQILQQPQ